MIFPTRRASKRALALQDAVIEREYTSTTEGDQDLANRAMIHARQDLVLLISMQTDIHRQLVRISRGVWFLGSAILVVALAIAFRA